MGYHDLFQFLALVIQIRVLAVGPYAYTTCLANVQRCAADAASLPIETQDKILLAEAPISSCNGHLLSSS